MTDGMAPGTARALQAGPLTLAYEHGGLRWIRFGGHEILRGIYVAVRDAHWRTIPPAIGDLALDAREDSFRITFVADHRHLEIDFRWRGTIVGDRNGGLTFTMDGLAQRTFRKNRIGLCVLHPVAECSGRPCTVEHVDGHITSASFPTLVSPHQAFREIRALAHEVVPGVIAEVRVEGDVFETEDQRNWSDTSFKTYSTPVDLPFPVEVSAGTHVRQEARLRLRGPIHVRGTTTATSADAVRIEATEVRCEIPRLGVMIDATHPLSSREASRLRAIGLSHVRVDLDLHTNAPHADWRRTLIQGAAQAEALAASLQIAALVPDADPRALLTALAEAGATLRVPIDAWLLFDRMSGTTPASLLAIARDLFAGRVPGRIGGGSNVHFADLNRNRPPDALLDLLVYPMSPQAHATDVETMVENIGSIADVRATARSFGAALPVSISPVSLKPRFKTGAAIPAPLGDLPDDIDPRQSSRFAAAWTVSHLRAAAESGIESVTYFRTVGVDGVMERGGGEGFPVYQALADIGAFGGGNAHILRSSDRQRVDALCLERDGRWRLLLVNLSAEPQRVHLPPIRDAHGVAAPLDLDGHAIVRLDSETPTKKGDSSPESPFI